MSIGLVGRKSGMTRVFTEEGDSVPVTVVEVQPNRVTQIKKPETDGYSAIQVTAGSCRASRVGKALAGHFAKANTEAGEGLWEFRTEDLAELEVGGEIKVDLFEVGQKVDVTGTSKGKGFQGGVKRTTSICRTQPTVTPSLTAHRDLSANAKPQAEYSKVRRWRARWVPSVKLPRVWKLCA